MQRRSPRFSLLGAILVLAACSIPVLPPTPSASASAAPVTPELPQGALLSIAASGVIPASAPYGCLASLLIDPATGTGPPDRIASWDDPRFAVDAAGAGDCEVSGPAIGGPPSLAPGRYRLRGVASIVSDLASPGFDDLPILGTTVSCELDLLVQPDTTGIAIHVTFTTDAPCTIDVTTT